MVSNRSIFIFHPNIRLIVLLSIERHVENMRTRENEEDTKKKKKNVWNRRTSTHFKIKEIKILRIKN